MRNAGLDEAQAGIKIAGRNVNNFRYADNTTLMIESKKELKSLLMDMKKESLKADLKLKIQKTRIMVLVPSLHGKWRNSGNSGRLYFLGLQNHCKW